jgi:hypothetical protein
MVRRDFRYPSLFGSDMKPRKLSAACHKAFQSHGMQETAGGPCSSRAFDQLAQIAKMTGIFCTPSSHPPVPPRNHKKVPADPYPATPGASLVRLCPQACRRAVPKANPEGCQGARIGCFAERIQVAVDCFRRGRDVRSPARDLPQRERRHMAALSRRRWTCFRPTQSQRVCRRSGDDNRARRLSRKRQSGSRASSRYPPDRQSGRWGLTGGWSCDLGEGGGK